ncbi:MAG: glycerol-3-phosphate 1-O-acyltransferase PlsY [Eubacteriales bacterium]
MDNLIFKLIISAIQAYLLGCIIFSYILSRIINKKDIRELGSGNAGSTNMLRNYGLKWGILALAGDVLKGSLAVFFGYLLAGRTGMYVAAVFVMLGHNWPVFLQFKGGKGIAVTLGALIVIMPIHTLIIFAAAIVIMVLTRTVSIGSLAGSVIYVITAFVFFPSDTYLHIAIIVLALSAFFSHRENIKRILKGQESKIKLSKNGIMEKIKKNKVKDDEPVSAK